MVYMVGEAETGVAIAGTKSPTNRASAAERTVLALR